MFGAAEQGQSFRYAAPNCLAPFEKAAFFRARVSGPKFLAQLVPNFLTSSGSAEVFGPEARRPSSKPDGPGMEL